MRSFVRLSLGAALAFAMAACSSSNSTTTNDAGADTSTVKDSAVADTSAADASDGAASCTLEQPISNTAACNDCGQANCCDQVNTCLNDTKCTDIITCLNDCADGKNPDASTFDAADQTDGGPNDVCVQACINASNATGLAEIKSYVTCVNTSCKTECAGG